MTPLSFRPLGRGRSWLALGLGVLLGAGAVAMWPTFGDEGQPPPGWRWPTQPVGGVASAGAENFVIATGPVDNDVEALYFLDFLTGDLRAAILNRRNPGFNAFFEYNITKDFDLGSTKNPKYLMVTGLANIPRGQGGTQIASSAVYIAEANTGQLAAYMLPWNSTLFNAGKPQYGTFYLVDKRQLRTAFVRDR